MPDFGFGTADFVSLIRYGYAVYEAYRKAPKDFQDICTEVRNLNRLLECTGKTIDEGCLDDHAIQQLCRLRAGCADVFNDLEETLGGFGSLGAPKAMSLSRLKWDPEEIMALRYRLISNVNNFTAFNTQLLLQK